MNVSLNIENDAELRMHIKEVIKGQVLSIVREDIAQSIRDEFSRKLKTISTDGFEMMIAEALRSVIEKVLRKDHDIGAWGKDFVKPIVENVVVRAMEHTDWIALISEAASKKLKSLI